MPYCKHCNAHIPEGQKRHECPKVGVLDVDDDAGSFLLSAVIGAATDSAALGGILGGDIVGGIVGDMLDGDLFD